MTKQIAVTDEAHEFIMLLKLTYGAKNVSETLLRAFRHAGYTPEWFKMIKLRLEGVPRAD